MFNRLKIYLVALFFVALFFPKNVFAQTIATYKINEVKNSEGVVLSQVKIYVDGFYVHHYASETLTFCEGCYCYDGSATESKVSCNFGNHTISLQKTGYVEWNETKLISVGDSFEVNPVMTMITPTPSSIPVPPTSTPTNTPTPEPTATLAPTPATKAIYQINKAKDNSGNQLSSVNIYVDDVYIHHQDNETLTFCSGCHCDPDNNVDCNLGSHKISMKKDGYEDWNETKTFNAGDNNTVNPILNKISPTATPTPTVTLVPSLSPTPTKKLTPTPTVFGEREVLASSTGEINESGPFVLGKQDTDLNLSNPEASKAFETQNNKNYLFPASAGILGLGFIGFSVFSFIKSKGFKRTEDKTLV